MSTANYIKTRLLILSDTHGALPDPNQASSQPFSQPLPHADVAIHAGDLTSTGKIEEHRKALTLLKVLPAPLKIVIPGNHDLTLDAEYCASHPKLYAWRNPHTPEELEAAKDLYTNEDAVSAGITYLVEGVKTFNLANGATLSVYASAYTPEFCDWGFGYPRDQDRFNMTLSNRPSNPVPDHDDGAEGFERVSVMVTHGPPYGILDRTDRGDHVGCEHLTKAAQRCRPLIHCFGHIHEAWGMEKRAWSQSQPPTKYNAVCDDGESSLGNQTQSIGYADATGITHGDETIFLNASIMDIRYRPCQKPWIVDLMLPAVAN